MVRSGVLTTVLVAAFALAAAPAGGQTLSPSPNPLPGSSFQGADGDQAPTALSTDWAPFQIAGRVTHSPDDNVQDSAFTGGTELYPDEWRLGIAADGVSPGQGNILDVWSSVDEVGSATFLYMAFARAAGTGTSYQTFELNRDNRRWRNSKGAQIPCRLDGDLMISFEPHGNQNTVDVAVRRWRTTSWDPASGCARRGTLGAAVRLSLANDIQGAANSTAIANSLPGNLGTLIRARQFGEIAINIGSLLGTLGNGCGAFTSVWMHSRSSSSVTSELKDFVAPQEIDLRRCSAAGTKWLDLNADGVRQGGEAGLEEWRVYADLDDNGRHDQGEPFAITDENGDYVVDDIRATGTYTLREEPASGAPGAWTCSSPTPCRWTVDAAAEPYAQDRDFGNWRPAQVTLIKQVDPPDDPGEFDLSVGDQVLRGAGDGERRTFDVPPGTHIVSETAAAGTDAADYVSSVSCSGSLQLSRPQARAASTTVQVVAGERVDCTFTNARIGVPSIAIDKVPPPATLTGEPLVYLLRVANPGSVPFAAESVEVSDSQCDDLVLTQQLGPGGAADATPGFLDPGDQWTYRCEVATTLPPDPDDCEPQTRENTATVTAPDVERSDSESARLYCPPPRRRSVQIVKVGPASAVAGTPLTYRLYVRNTGEASFAEGDVEVSDPSCDAPPVVVARYAGAGADVDSSPTVMDPGDVWVYECTRTTTAPAADCRPFSLPNTATVLVQTPNRPDAEDDDTYRTPMTCPPAPPGPPGPPGPPAPPGPGPSGDLPEVPDAPDVPDAGTAGVASLRSLPRCLRRGSRVTIRGARMASVRVTVRGRRVGGLRTRALQRRVVIRLLRNFPPGRHRVTARIRFQRGAATPTLRLTRTVRICAPPAVQEQPRFTG